MKHILLGLFVAAVVALATMPAEAYSRYPRGPRGGHYAGHAPRYYPYRGGYHRPRHVYYPPVPVYRAYPAHPVYRRPHTGFSYFGPGFSFSIGH